MDLKKIKNIKLALMKKDSDIDQRNKAEVENHRIALNKRILHLQNHHWKWELYENQKSKRIRRWECEKSWVYRQGRVGG